MKNKESFWVTNISKRNVSLADLNLTIKSYTSVDLLSKHYYYTKEQLIKSVESGSIFKKRDKIVVRKISPEILKANMPFLKDSFIPSRERSVIEIKEELYEELDVSDEKFAEENADLNIDETFVKKV
jgi:hypothetical protein